MTFYGSEMEFDVVVTTCNRPKELRRLIDDLLTLFPQPGKIIVIDSSDKEDLDLAGAPFIVYGHTLRKNQPYQRLMGASKSDAELVFFFDDDVTIADPDIFKDVLQVYHSHPEVVAVGVGIRYKNNISDIGESRGVKTNSGWFRVFNPLTGVYIPKPGKIAKAGITGGPAISDGYVDFLNGPMMSFRTSIVRLIFDSRLLSSYSHKMGKGEDKYLSMGASAFGKLYMLSKQYVDHPSNESHYFVDPVSFQKRVIFSRWLLSRRLASVRGDHIFFYRLHFVWFAFCRLMISFISSVIKPTDLNKSLYRGQLGGIKLLLTKYQVITTSENDANWTKFE